MRNRFKIGVGVTALLLMLAVGAQADEAALQAAMTSFRDHAEASYSSGTGTVLTAAQIQTLQGTIYANRAFTDDSLATMEQAKELINYYANNSNHKIFRQSPTYNGFNHDDFSTVLLAEAQFVVTLQQNVLTYCFGESELAAYPAYFDGFAFDCAKHFPGNVNPPGDSNAVYSVQINASQPYPWGYDVLWSEDPAKRATGAYLAPGSIGTVMVPPELVNQGYVVRVGAHVHNKGGDDGGNTDSYTTQTWNGMYKTKMERMDSVTRDYVITSTNTPIANPLGGNIYIEVPVGSTNGIVTVQFKNTVRAPFYAKLPWHQTTLSQWQSTERTYPGAFADFESEKCMFTIPSNWIYAFDDPETMMRTWDMCMDAISDMQGLPLIRNKTILYGIVDTSFKGGAGSPGYPQSNHNPTWPPNKAGDNPGDVYLYGPKFSDSIHLHELGHGISISKFAGEVESSVHLPYVVSHNRKFGVTLDEAYGRSNGNDINSDLTLNDGGLMWILSPEFRAGNYMTATEMNYQHRGWGKYVDIARLFGWKALHDFWYSEAVDEETYGNIYDTNPTVYADATSDNRILRMSKAAGVDLTPLLELWGVGINNYNTLKASMVANGLKPSARIYERLVEFQREIIPMTQAQFNTHYSHINSALNTTTRTWYDPLKASFDVSVAYASIARIQQIINQHFPDGPPNNEPTNLVIYTDQFDGAGGGMDRRQTTQGNGYWIADPILTDDGVLGTNGGSAVLRFDPRPNETYTVSLDFNCTGGTSGWLGLGFSSQPPTSTDAANSADRFTGANVPGIAWMIYRTDNTVSAFEGPKTAGFSFNSSAFAPGTHNLKIVMDTTGDGSTFTADFQVDNVSVSGGPQIVDGATVKDINYVGITQYGGASIQGTVHNLQVLNNTWNTNTFNKYNYSELFNGQGGALNGKKTTTGNGTWIANSIVKDTGVLTGDAGSAMLAFNPTTNEVYTLSMAFNYSAGSGGWVGLGFSTAPPVYMGAASTADRFTGANVPGIAWMIYNANNTVTVYEGPQSGATTIPSSGTFSNGVHTLKITLDTTGNGSNFLANFFIDGVSVTGGPKPIDAVTVSEINYVGFSQYGGGTVSNSVVDSFWLRTGNGPDPSLTDPPPSSYHITETFTGLAGLGLNGRTTTTGGGVWIANSIVTNNGSGTGVLTASSGSAVLPFNPETNQIYTIAIDFNHISTGASWTGLGFCSAPPAAAVGGSSNSDRFSNNPSGYAWMLYNEFNSVVTYEGPKAGLTTNGFGGPYAPGVHTMKVVIDTHGNGSTFTADYFVDGVSVTGGPQLIDAVTVSGIHYAGFSQTTLSTNSTVDNFLLINGVIPTVSPVLDYSPLDGNLVFNWTGGGFKLQMQTTNSLAVGLSTNWVDVPGGATSGVSVPVTDNPTAFFRLIWTP